MNRQVPSYKVLTKGRRSTPIPAKVFTVPCPLTTVRNFPEKLPLTKVGQVYSLFLPLKSAVTGSFVAVFASQIAQFRAKNRMHLNTRF
jgi:hypothetical protein